MTSVARSYTFSHTPGPTRYFTLGAATLMLTLGLTARPDSSLTHWADKEAEKRIDGTA